MEYHVQFEHPIRQPNAIEDAIRGIDPAATVSMDAAAGRLRVASWFELADLLLLLHRCGQPVEASQVTQLPSTCCGGCSG